MTCSRCGTPDDLYKNNMCKTCRREYNREWYAKNKERHKVMVAATRPARQARFYETINAIKDVPCADCKNRFPSVCMDFDHLGDKSTNIAHMTQASMERLLAEIAKCEVVCANCHRIRTNTRLCSSTDRTHSS